MVDSAAGTGLRRIAPEAGRPGGWLLRGARMAVPDRDVWDVIQRSLRAEPWAACLKCGDVVLSRSAVLCEVERIAALLPGRRVGLHLPRSIASVLWTLAIWRNGATYVPIAADAPHARVQAIARSCVLDVVVADRVLALDGYGPAQAIGEPPLYLHMRSPGAPALDDDASSGADASSGDDAIGYIAHTSGSTGMPKGVRVSHDNLLNRIACMRDFLGVRAEDRILYKTSAVFDVHVWEFTLPLAAGCLMVIYPQSRAFDLPEISRIMTADALTIVGFVPALLRLLLDMPGFLAANALRAVLCGGEAWSPALARDFHARLPGRCLYNSYGPAETTIAVANWPVPDDPGLPAICLGAPLANLAFLIEEESGSIDADGRTVSGALHVGGAQVAHGYVDGASNRFFERVIDGEPVRFYATGDLVRLDRTDGSVHFKGRCDNQVKVNGMRIELEEIEEAVRSIDAIEGCIAFVADQGRFAQLCVAYKTRGNVGMQPAQVRQACAARLPAPLVPARFKQVVAIPLAATGKVDRQGLTA